jgi:hypothetical protein
MTTLSIPTQRTGERDAVLARAAVCVRYLHDRDSGLWHFAVGNPAILGGACRSREEAERRAAEAIARALTTGRPHACGDEDGDVGGFEVDIRTAPR